MVEQRTPVPDHSIYSLTPADNKAVKCNWTADILLYLMHKAGGLPLLFAFRYLCMLFLLWLIWLYAGRVGQGKNVFTFFLLIAAGEERENVTDWEKYLKHFLKLAPNHQKACIVRQVFEGKGLPSEKKQPFVQKENGTGPNR